MITPSTTETSRYTSAVQAYLIGDATEAERIAATLEPGSVAAALMEARRARQREGWEASLALLEKMARQNLAPINAGDPAAVFWEVERNLQLGITLLNLGRRAEAVDPLFAAKSRALDAGLWERAGRAQYNLAVCFDELGRRYDFMRELNALGRFCEERAKDRGLDGVRPLWRRARAVIAFQEGNLERALDEVDRGLAFYSQHPYQNDRMTLLFLRGQIFLRQGRFDLCDRVIDEMTRLNGVRTQGLWRRRALLLRAIRGADLREQASGDEWAALSSGNLSETERGWLEQCRLKEIGAVDLEGDSPATQPELRSAERGDAGRFEEDDVGLDALMARLRAHGPDAVADDLAAWEAVLGERNLPFNRLKLLRVRAAVAILAGDAARVRALLCAQIEVARRHGYAWDEYGAWVVLAFVEKKFFGRKLANADAARARHLAAHFAGAAPGLSLKGLEAAWLGSWPFQLLVRVSQRLEYSFDWKTAELITHRFQRRPLRGQGLVLDFLRALDRRRGQYVGIETLARALWNETYHPFVHNPRLYNLARKAREALERAGGNPEWLRTRASRGYQLVRSQGGAGGSLDAVGTSAGVAAKTAPSERLLGFLRAHPRHARIYSKDLVGKFGYSARQAQRDLRILVARKWVRPVGGKRNRHYLIHAGIPAGVVRLT